MNGAPEATDSAARGWLGFAACLLFVLLSTGARTWRATSDPNFETSQAAGMLKSDPALLYYLTERILDAGGGMPADFRADPRVQHPALTDIPAEFTVGQEFLLAWAYALTGSEESLHVFASRLMALLASLSALGIYGVVFWRTRRVAWALAAAGLFCLLPANYRTIGFILVREDLSLPLFLGHLALLARAEKLRSARAYLWSGLWLALALASWHAMGFFVLLELLVLHAWFLRPGASPFESRGAWAVMLGPIAAATLVPALHAVGFLSGTAMQLALALLVLAWFRERHRTRHGGEPLGRGLSILLTSGLVAIMAGGKALLHPGRSGYSHVFDVLEAKLVHLGARPADPNLIPFDARLLWQGPFEALPLAHIGALMGWALWLLPLVLWLAIRGRRALAGFDAFLLFFTLLALPSAWLIGRTVILLGALLPMLFVLLPGQKRGGILGLAIGCMLLAQAVSFVRFLDGLRLSWYLPPERQTEIRALVEWVDQNLEQDQPIVGDFMNSTAILAHSGNPIVLQPKYETQHSRDRARLFLEAFFEGTPAEMSALVRAGFQSDLLLVDRYTLGKLSPWVAGSVEGPRAGSVGELLLSTDPAVLEGIPGYELLYRSPASIQGGQAISSDYFRLYRLH